MNEYVLWIDGMHMYVRVSGSGQPLVLLHGLGGPHTWQAALPFLQKDFTVVLIHLPGFGFSSRNYVGTTISFFTDMLHRVILRLGITRCLLAGISMGGQIAIDYAASNLRSTEKLILIAPTGIRERARMWSSAFVWKPFSTLMTSFLLKQKRLINAATQTSFLEPTLRPEGLFETVFSLLNQPGSREAWVHAFQATVTESPATVEQKLKNITLPTLVLWGSNDKIVPARSGQHLRQLLKTSTLITFPDCGHSLPLEKPRELAEAIRRFVKGV